MLLRPPTRGAHGRCERGARPLCVLSSRCSVLAHLPSCLSKTLRALGGGALSGRLERGDVAETALAKADPSREDMSCAVRFIGELDGRLRLRVVPDIGLEFALPGLE